MKQVLRAIFLGCLAIMVAVNQRLLRFQANVTCLHLG